MTCWKLLILRGAYLRGVVVVIKSAMVVEGLKRVVEILWVIRKGIKGIFIRDSTMNIMWDRDDAPNKAL